VAEPLKSPAPALRCRDLHKSFPGVTALGGVDLDLGAGSVHALVGENGAGKSTLVNILSGALQPDAGHIEVAGRRTLLRGPRHAQRLGIAVVHQEFNLVADLSVGENILLGRWPRRWAGLVDFTALDRQAQAALQALDLDLPLHAPVRGLPVAGQQMVEIAKALSLDARVLILDEPSAVLTQRELQALFRLVRRLAERGVAVMYISHRLEEILELADQVTVLRDGRRVSTRPVAGASRRQLIAEMVGREMGDEFPARRAAHGEVVLQVDRLSARGRFEQVSFDVRAGEVLGLAGLVGAGRTSLLQAMFGAIPVISGRVSAGGRRGPFRGPRQAMAAGLAYLPEDRKKAGLLLEQRLRDNITLAELRSCTRWGLLSPRFERTEARRLMADLGIKARGPDAAVRTLSGGNQQKVLLARWLRRPHRVMLLDEPTRGIDVGAKVEIYSLINRLAERGVAVVLASSELPEIIGMADRIAVLRGGRIMGTLDNRSRNVTQEQVMQLAAG
jgi:ribose transport system ATP-binding protein